LLFIAAHWLLSRRAALLFVLDAPSERSIVRELLRWPKLCTLRRTSRSIKENSLDRGKNCEEYRFLIFFHESLTH
jgi:hypothetical protein